MGYSPWGLKELDMTEQLTFLLFTKNQTPTSRDPRVAALTL